MDGNSEDRKPDMFDDGREEDASLPVKEDLVVALPIEDSLDLHTFSPKEIKPLVEEYLYQCQQRGVSRGSHHSWAWNRHAAEYRPFALGQESMRGRIQRRPARVRRLGRHDGAAEGEGALTPRRVRRKSTQRAHCRDEYDYSAAESIQVARIAD